MALVVIGLVVGAFGIHYWRATSTPNNGVEVAGTVTAVERRKTRQTGNSRMLHGPTVSYRDPMSGKTIVLPPDSMRPEVYQEGDAVVVIVDPATGKAVLPTSSVLSKRLLFFGAAVVLILLGLYDSFS